MQWAGNLGFKKPRMHIAFCFGNLFENYRSRNREGSDKITLRYMLESKVMGIGCEWN
jgi:hypothetical protein